MFLKNKYTKWYFSIIENAKQFNRSKKEEYYESHHIIPRCMGGKEMVLLTGKEHFICHLLLCKMVESSNKYKMINGLLSMAYRRSDNQYRYTSRSYSLIRKFIAEKNSALFKGVPKSEITKNNMKGNNGKWIRTEFHKKQISERQTGKNVGDTNPAKRIDVKEKISKAASYYGNNPTKLIIEGRSSMKQKLKNKRWYTNGTKDIFTELCPTGYFPGRSVNRKNKNAS